MRWINELLSLTACSLACPGPLVHVLGAWAFPSGSRHGHQKLLKRNYAFDHTALFKAPGPTRRGGLPPRRNPLPFAGSPWIRLRGRLPPYVGRLLVSGHTPHWTTAFFCKGNTYSRRLKVITGITRVVFFRYSAKPGIISIILSYKRVRSGSIDTDALALNCSVPTSTVI